MVRREGSGSEFSLLVHSGQAGALAAEYGPAGSGWIHRAGQGSGERRRINSQQPLRQAPFDALRLLPSTRFAGQVGSPGADVQATLLRRVQRATKPNRNPLNTYDAGGFTFVPLGSSLCPSLGRAVTTKTL